MSSVIEVRVTFYGCECEENFSLCRGPALGTGHSSPVPSRCLCEQREEATRFLTAREVCLILSSLPQPVDVV